MPSPPRIRTTDLPAGHMGLWDEVTRTLWLDTRLTPAERRSTLAHELVHAERGDVPCEDPVLDARQERRVEREAARRLLPLGALAEALRWSDRATEVAALLEVDRSMLEARLASLTSSEAVALAERVAGAPP